MLNLVDLAEAGGHDVRGVSHDGLEAEVLADEPRRWRRHRAVLLDVALRRLWRCGHGFLREGRLACCDGLQRHLHSHLRGVMATRRGVRCTTPTDGAGDWGHDRVMTLDASGGAELIHRICWQCYS